VKNEMVNLVEKSYCGKSIREKYEKRKEDLLMDTDIDREYF
jgi:hypothetical protein